MDVRINGKTANLDKALPLTLGDWRALKKNHGLTMTGLATLITENPDMAAMFLLHVVQKANPSITEADIDTLSMQEIIRIGRAINDADSVDEDDRPFSPPSTSSPPTTDGPNTT